MVVMVSSKVSSRSREREGFRRPSDREDIDYRGRGQLGLATVLYLPARTWERPYCTYLGDGRKLSQRFVRLSPRSSCRCPLRRLMRNSEKQGRSRDFMLTPNLDQKAVPHGSRLLPGLIVRSHRGLVEGSTPLLHCSQSRRRSSIAHLRSGDPHPRCPRPVAPLQEREGFLEVRSGSPARLFPHTPLPEPVQPED